MFQLQAPFRVVSRRDGTTTAKCLGLGFFWEDAFYKDPSLYSMMWQTMIVGRTHLNWTTLGSPACRTSMGA